MSAKCYDVVAIGISHSDSLECPKNIVIMNNPPTIRHAYANIGFPSRV